MKSGELFAKNAELFTKTNQVLVDLEAADAAIKTSLEGRIGQLEQVVQLLSSASPLAPPAPPGMQPQPAGHSAAALLQMRGEFSASQARDRKELTDRIALAEQALLKAQSDLADCNRNLGTRLASLESRGGDAWAAQAETQRQGVWGAAPQAAEAAAPSQHPRTATSAGIPMPVSDPGASRRFLDDKVAQSSAFQYDSGKAAQWVLKVRN